MRRTLLLAIAAVACGGGSGDEVLGNLHTPTEIVADESGVYVADEDQIVGWIDGKRMSRVQGMRVNNVAVDSDAVYFVAYDSTKQEAEIRRLSKQGGAVTVLATDWPLVDLEVDGNHVYWNSVAIRRIPKSGGKPETLVPGESVQLSSELAFDDKYVYFIGTSAIARVPKDGGPVEALFAAEVDTAARPTVHDDVVWWTENDWTVLKRAKLGGDVETIALAEYTFVSGLAWLDGMLVLDGVNRKLLRVDGAGKATTVKEFDAGPVGLAVVGRTIYVSFEGTTDTAARVRRY